MAQAKSKPPIIRRARRALVALRARQQEIDVGLAPADRVGERAARAARHRPAERAVAGVEAQVAIARAARSAARSTASPDAARPRTDARRGSPASGKSSNVRRVSASQRTGLSVRSVARELGGAGDAHAVAEARQHDLPREVGQRHRRRAAVRRRRRSSPSSPWPDRRCTARRSARAGAGCSCRAPSRTRRRRASVQPPSASCTRTPAIASPRGVQPVDRRGRAEAHAARGGSARRARR